MRRSPLTVIYLTVFIDLLGFGIILPLLPLYAEELGAGGVWVGGILTAYSGLQFLSAPFLGRLSDRIGRRPVILASLAGSVAGFLITGFAGSLWALLAGRAVAGASGGSIAPAQAYIADVTTPGQRTKAMGLLGACIGLGFVLGPALGAGLSHFGFGAASFTAAGLAGANLLLGYFILTEPRREQAASTDRRPTLASLLTAFTKPVTRRLLLATFLTTFAFVAMEATFALLGERRYDLSEARLGLIFAFGGVVIIIVQGGLVGRLSAQIGERATAACGAAILTGGLLLLPLAPGLGVAALLLGLIAAGQGLVSPALSSMLSLHAESGKQGGLLGLGQAHAAAARAIGPIVAGALFDADDALPYLVAGLIAAGVVVALLGVSAKGRAGKSRTFSPVTHGEEKGS
ncbi:MAG: TCR/Tet family MFS transporter [Chloroflexi bacterium]|nr:TCR/Tet family MFS transporter [Chloroflexota bacterium]